jgi:16S rRNA (adenine1518-N6/adenine1519-N6)-dimethyltransferase
MSLAADGLPPLREVIAAHGLEPRKALGQNFLFDLNLTRKIARAAGPLAGVAVVEVGPGPGGLTRALLSEGAEKVIAIERDARALGALVEIAAHWPGRLEIIEGDALSVPPRTLIDRAGAMPIRIVANLPYNIATPLLAGWLEAQPWPPFYDRLTLMFQREVAERIVATPAERADYGRLAVLAGWRGQARILFDIPPAAFVPAPKVTSSVVELVPRARPEPCDAATLSALAQAAQDAASVAQGFRRRARPRPCRPHRRRRPRTDHAGGGGRRLRLRGPGAGGGQGGQRQRHDRLAPRRPNRASPYR